MLKRCILLFTSGLFYPGACKLLSPVSGINLNSFSNMEPGLSKMTGSPAENKAPAPGYLF